MRIAVKLSVLLSLVVSGSALAQYEHRQTAQQPLPRHASPAYTNAVIHYIQTPVDHYGDNPTGTAVSFEQQFTPQFFVSGHFKSASTGLNDSTYDLETEDAQLGVGWFERSAVGPFVDTSVLVGRETIVRPDDLGYNRDRSDYFGVQIGLRESHGPLEVQAAAGYFFHSGARDDQFRWSLSAYINLNRYLSVGLGFDHHDDYEIRSLRLRLRW